MPKNFKRSITKSLNFLCVVGSALYFWHFLMLATNCEMPIVVVLSGSMEPAYFRGDILFVHNWKRRVDVGDVIVF